ncbi:dephospho-CoA kinase [bacterium]|nr:dephospho-CoA kinase [bacterium]
MKVWGLTGQLGTGKSTATEYLGTLGYPSVNLEDLFRRSINKDTDDGREGFTRIYKIFGNEVLNSLGQLDPRKLGQKLMLNPEDRKRIEEAIDPLVNDLVEKKRIEWKEQGVELGFVEGARVFESGMDKNLRGVVAIEADFNKRVKRIAKRDHMGENEVKMMFQMQDNAVISRLSKVKWKNDGSIPALKKQIDAFVDEQLAAE